ncbi:hypothetical protein [Limnoglobus roseus]|uniref:Uncharacterized protein n=1 Tax=Limnoglobus roseus TaxID=2598579 RepID=A0A5C1ACS7_9BACT|nr:hypothetical protein [Limnoglobus roseus]QEL15572.1 hypothetical protein PX52LOC_02497 [Limnoglobus roseus]
MWRMHSGDRVLTAAEWALFRVGLDLLLMFVEDDLDNQEDTTETGATAFDRLTAEQKLVILADVATALREPAVPMPHHTAANEAAIAAVVYTLDDMLTEELESSSDPDSKYRSTVLRRHLLAVAAEQAWEELPRLKSKSRGRWAVLLESFGDLILWDDDHHQGDAFLDLPPKEARVRLLMAGITDEYFLDTPDEPGEKGLTRARQQLARLFDRVPPDDRGLYAGLLDNFTGVQVGPMTAEQVAEWAAHPWLEEIAQGSPVWDCSYARWAERLSGRLPGEAFELTAAVPGVAYDLPAGVRAEVLAGKWVIRSGDGSYWVDVIGNGWADAGVFNENISPVEFETEADAKAAYVQADRLYAERAARYRAAVKE